MLTLVFESHQSQENSQVIREKYYKVLLLNIRILFTAKQSLQSTNTRLAKYTLLQGVSKYVISE